MTYNRVIPRDLFNESALLKCLGRIYICAERLTNREVLRHNGATFDIHQSSADGSIHCSNVTVIAANGERLVPYRPLNSRESWSLYVCHGYDCEEIEVFDNSGEFTPEFAALLTGGN